MDFWKYIVNKKSKIMDSQNLWQHVRCADVSSVFTQSVSLFFLKHEVIAARNLILHCVETRKQHADASIRIIH